MKDKGSMNTDVSSDTQAMQTNTEVDTTVSKYIQYSNSALEDTAQLRRVLFFYASWCPTCRPVDEELSQNASQIPEDVRVIRVNYNDPDTDSEEKVLAQKYEVTYQHTFVQISSDGTEIAKWNGGGLGQLLENIQ